jgi:hypothetical protein
LWCFEFRSEFENFVNRSSLFFNEIFHASSYLCVGIEK